MIGAPFDIEVARCRVNQAAREVKPIHVETLARSIEEVGLIQPISVRRVGDDFEVIAGVHRLMAFRQMGREYIPAVVRETDDLRAELALIDENLIRNELSPAERALAISRRKAIYEALHPETKPTSEGGEGRRKATRRQAGDESVADRFTKDTAQQQGRSERSVQRDSQRGELGEATLKKVAGTSLDTGEELDALAKLAEAAPEKAEALIERAVAGEDISVKIVAKKEVRNARERDLADKQRALRRKKYGLIYVDVPRHFHVRSDETGMDRSPENHYPTMTFEELCDLPVQDIAADDCILIYWSTAASLIDDLEIMAEWGFVTFRPREAGRLRRDEWRGDRWSLPNEIPQPYRSMQVWDKVKIGLGYWFRDRHEFILVGARGNVVAPAPGTQDHSIVSAAKGEHSEKPDHVAQMIERLWPNTPKIELFARAAREGWDIWGKEAPTCSDGTMPAPAEAQAQCRPETSFETQPDPAAPEPVSEPDLPQAPDAGSPLIENETTSPPETVASSEPAPDSPAPKPPGAGSPSSDDDDLKIPAFLRREDPHKACVTAGQNPGGAG